MIPFLFAKLWSKSASSNTKIVAFLVFVAFKRTRNTRSAGEANIRHVSYNYKEQMSAEGNHGAAKSKTVLGTVKRHISLLISVETQKFSEVLFNGGKQIDVPFDCPQNRF